MNPADVRSGLADRDRPLAAVVACAAPRPVGARVANALGPGLDWRAFVDAASAHRLLEPAGRALEQPGIECPEWVRALVHQRQAETAAANLVLCSTLLELLAGLRRQGIPALPFRGPVLAASVWGRLSLRRSIDLDVLVPRDALPGARDVLGGMGFALQEREARLLDGPFPWVEHHFVFRRPDGPVAIELHTALSSWCFSLPIDIASLFRASRVVTLAGEAVTTLSREDVLFELAIHGTKHQWACLRHVCDLAEAVCAHADADWASLLDRAGAAGGRRILLGGVWLAHCWMQAPLPPLVRARVAADPWVLALPARLERRLRAFPQETPPWRKAWRHAASRERRRDRVRYLARIAAESMALGITLEVLPRLRRGPRSAPVRR